MQQNTQPDESPRKAMTPEQEISVKRELYRSLALTRALLRSGQELTSLERGAIIEILDALEGFIQSTKIYTML